MVKRSQGNLRQPPAYITPNLVRTVLDQIGRLPALPAPVVAVPVRGDPPVLRVVDKEIESSLFPAETKVQVSPPEELQCLPVKGSERGVDEGDGSAPTAEQAHQPSRSSTPQVLPKKRRKNGEWLDAPETLALFAIADRRGIAAVDLAHAMGRHERVVLLALKLNGYIFGRRMPLAERLTLPVLKALADDQVPVPELRSAKLKRERLEREGLAKRERRRLERAGDPTFKPKTESYSPRATPPAAETRPAPITPPVQAATYPAITLPRPTSIFVYAERVTEARQFLVARGHSVKRHDCNDPIPRWAVSGQYGLLTNEHLFELAGRLGWEPGR